MEKSLNYPMILGTDVQIDTHRFLQSVSGKTL